MSLLDLNVNSTSRLGLEPIKTVDGKGYLYNGCIPASIIDVSVISQKHEKGEFKDLEVPVLAIEFTNYKLKADDPDRFLTLQIKPIGSKKLQPNTTDQYVDREATDIIADNNETWKLIKHLLESLSQSPNYRRIVDIPKDHLMKYFDLPDLGKAEDRLEKYKLFFTYIAEFINGDGNVKKSMIVDASGQPLHIWVKLLPNYDKDPKRNAKYYAVPRFIGSGVFEPLKIDATTKFPVAPRIIKVKATESLELIATGTSTKPAVNIPGASGAPAGGADLSQLPADIRELMMTANGGAPQQ